MRGPWEVNIKGAFCEPSFEISVLRSDNLHGKRSYGWFDENKLLISHSGGPCKDSATLKIWGKLIKVAREVVDELNADEGKPQCP